MQKTLNIGRRAALTVLASVPLTGMTQTPESSYPNKPIRLIVPAAGGGPTDITARMVGEKLGQVFGQPVVIDNRPGGGMMIGTNAVAKAVPDGYTLLWSSSTPVVTVPAISKSVPYEVEELVTVSRVCATPLALYVAAGTPVKNMKELLDFVRSNPDRAFYGSIGDGTSVHLLNELMLKQTNVKMTHVAYKGVAPELVDLMGGQILTGGGDVGSAATLIKAGRIRPIAITGSTRSAALPEIPTFSEQGFSGLDPLGPWFGLFAPKKTPKAIVTRISAEIQKIVKAKDFSDRLVALGLEPIGLLSDESEKMTRDDIAHWKLIVQNSGVKFN